MCTSQVGAGGRAWPGKEMPVGAIGGESPKEGKESESADVSDRSSRVVRGGGVGRASTLPYSWRAPYCSSLVLLPTHRRPTVEVDYRPCVFDDDGDSGLKRGPKETTVDKRRNRLGAARVAVVVGWRRSGSGRGALVFSSFLPLSSSSLSHARPPPPLTQLSSSLDPMPVRPGTCSLPNNMSRNTTTTYSSSTTHTHRPRRRPHPPAPSHHTTHTVPPSSHRPSPPSHSPPTVSATEMPTPVRPPPFILSAFTHPP